MESDVGSSRAYLILMKKADVPAAYIWACKKCHAKRGMPCMRPRGVPARNAHKERVDASGSMPNLLKSLADIEMPDIDEANGVLHYFMCRQESLLNMRDPFQLWNACVYRTSMESLISHTKITTTTSHLRTMSGYYGIKEGETTMTDESIERAFSDTSKMYSNVALHHVA